MMFFENDVPMDFVRQKGAGHDRAWTAHGLGAYRLGTRMDRRMGPSSSREPKRLTKTVGMSENVGYIPNEIAIFHRDNDH